MSTKEGWVTRRRNSDKYTSEYFSEMGKKVRPPQLSKAWDEQDKIRDLYVGGVSVKEICKMYDINYRSCYRIISL